MLNKDGTYSFKNWEDLKNFIKFYNNIECLIDFAEKEPDLWMSFKEHHRKDLDKLEYLLSKSFKK